MGCSPSNANTKQTTRAVAVKKTADQKSIAFDIPADGLKKNNPKDLKPSGDKRWKEKSRDSKETEKLRKQLQEKDNNAQKRREEQLNSIREKQQRKEEYAKQVVERKKENKEREKWNNSVRLKHQEVVRDEEFQGKAHSKTKSNGTNAKPTAIPNGRGTVKHQPIKSY